MKAKLSNKNLNKAGLAKKDEFFTQLSDIEKELDNYKDQFKEKVVYANSDNPFESNFFKYFVLNFNSLRIKKLITTNFGKGTKISEKPLKAEITHVPENYLVRSFEFNSSIAKNLLTEKDNSLKLLNGNGDFRSSECVEILKEANLVVTNPPFSLFREFVALLIHKNKKFLILGDQNAVTYSEIFKLIKDNKLWLGYDNGGTKWFRVPMDYDIPTKMRKKVIGGSKYFSMGRVLWYTNLDTEKRHQKLTLSQKYSQEKYLEFDYYNAINVDRCDDIPSDFNGVMGVPITFIGKYNPEQFEIISANEVRRYESVPLKSHGLIKDKDSAINGKPTYVRVAIKHKNPT